MAVEETAAGAAMATNQFENANMRLVEKDGYTNWVALKQEGHETTLADFEEAIAALIAKHGRDAGFYMTSDRGDDYFILKLK